MFFGRLAAPSSPTLSGEGYQAGYQQVWPVATAELPSTWLRCERCLGSRGEIRGGSNPPFRTKIEKRRRRFQQIPQHPAGGPMTPPMDRGEGPTTCSAAPTLPSLASLRLG